MRSLRQALRQSALIALGLLLAGCSSGGGDDESGGQMFLESCSLGCGSGSTGTPVNCAIVNVAQNVQITMVFSKPVQQSSLSDGFLLINALTGTVPSVSFSVDPGNPRRVIARPQVSFDDNNNPIFALAAGATYDLIVPGASVGGSGPFIQSTSGQKNQTELRCTIRTTEALNDPVPGPPVQSTFVDVADGSGGLLLDQPANGATNVDLGTNIRVVFDDIMNPATLSNPTNGTSPTVSVRIDPDGNVADPTDQVEIAGTYTTVVDFANLRTVLTFDPAAGLFSGGGDPMNPRRVVVRLPNSIRDIVGNPLANAGQVVFVPELQSLDAIVLPQAGGEPFTDTDNQDPDESGAAWGGGRLTFGIGGGAGRLGELIVRSGETVTLDTDSQTFPLPQQYDNLLTNESIGGGDYNPNDPSTWPEITVTDGDFDFTRVVIEPNATLILEGSQPGRVFSRGDLVVNGVLDVSGRTPEPHLSNTWRPWDQDGDSNPDPPTAQDFEAAYGGPGGVGGPFAGSGGAGGDRYFYEVGANVPDQNVLNRIKNAGGITYNDDPVPNKNGRAGAGIGQAGTLAAGPGGAAYPALPPFDSLINNWGSTQLSFTDTTSQTSNCRVTMVAGPGGGGAYALNGSAADPQSDVWTTTETPFVLPTTPAPTSGGDNSALNLEPPGQVTIRSLDAGLGLLRGGSGGGGGGTHFWGSRQVGAAGSCNGATMFPMFDHSGAGGGGGGGALQATSGRTLRLNGRIDAAGGDGGSSLEANVPLSACAFQGQTTSPDFPGLQENILACGSNASPGGGGSGGAVKLQGAAIVLANQPDRLSVAGGAGGVGVGGSMGGAGGPGLVRLEFSGFTGNQADHADDFADHIAPFQPGDMSFNTPFTSAAILSLGNFTVERIRPDSFSASMSCWMKPEGNFFGLDFAEDDAGDPDDPEGKAWNMDVIYDDNGTERLFPYRGIPTGDPEFPLIMEDFEGRLNDNLINHDQPSTTGSLISVRFQGARLSGALGDPCNVNLESPGSDIEVGSLTTWVKHPADLNLFTPKPNMVRFVVVFEQALKVVGAVEARIQGITNLRVNVQPN